MHNNVTKYFIGIGWFILSLICSTLNDILAKYAGSYLPSYEIVFFRCFFGTVSLVPFIFYLGPRILYTSHPIIQFFRGTILFVAIVLWTKALSIAQVSTATVMSFTTPIFTLILAFFFLKENIIWQRWLATLTGFLGVVITMKIHNNNFEPEFLFFLISAIAFAILDIINKKYIFKESILSMLFYTSLITSIFAFYPAIQTWIKPSYFSLLLLLILGISSNLLLYFLLKAFLIIDATAIAPYRYLELILSALAAYLVFGETIDIETLIGASIIIPMMLFIIYSDKQRINQNF